MPREEDTPPSGGELAEEEVLWEQFVAWEHRSRDTIDLKKIYIDMAEGNHIYGTWLSQQVYWELPNKRGEPRTTVKIDGKWWVAKDADEWWEETRITEKPLQTCMNFWTARGIIESQVHMYQKRRMRHTRIIPTGFLQRFESCQMETYKEKEVAKWQPLVAKWQFLLLQRLSKTNDLKSRRGRNQNGKKSSLPSKLDSESDKKAPGPQAANLVGEYIDQYRVRMPNVPKDWKPSGKDIGLLGKIAAHGITKPEFGAMIGCAPQQFRLSVTFLYNHSASLRVQAKESGLYRPPEFSQTATAPSRWKLECETIGCGWVGYEPYLKAPPSAVCQKDPAHTVNVSIVGG